MSNPNNPNTPGNATDAELIEMAKNRGLDPKDLDPDYVPEDVAKLDAGNVTEEERKKAQHAYKKQNDVIKRLRSEVMKRDAELNAVKTERAKPVQEKPTVEKVHAALQREAMTNLGIEEVKTEAERMLLQAEFVRLYNEKTMMLREENRAAEVAGKVIDEELSKFEILDDTDKDTIKKAIERLPATSRIDRDIIKNAVYMVVGQKALRPKPSEDTVPGDNTAEPVEPAAVTTSQPTVSKQGQVAASAVKTGGGVRIPASTGSDAGDSKIATPKEIEDMRAIGFSGTIAEFRDISRKAVSQYSGVGI